jgi:hypothetical protein
MKVFKMGGACSTNRHVGHAYKTAFRKLKGLLTRPKCSFEDNIKTDLKDVKCDGVVWIKLNGAGPTIGSYEHSNKASGYTK